MDERADTAGRSWYRSMSPRERRTFWACFGGWATDAMDVQIYSLLIPVLISVGLLASNAEAGLISTVTLRPGRQPAADLPRADGLRFRR